jgi:repressor LexA
MSSWGKISAGGPIEAVPDKDILELEHMFSNEKCYALKVQGDSMIEAGINDGDWVIVEKKNKIPKSKVAVILIDNQDVTLKYYKLLNKNTVELIPANKKFNTMEYDISRISIQGIVIGQIRVY